MHKTTLDQRWAENYHKFGEHFTTEYYITFVYQLPSDIDSKTNGLFKITVQAVKNGRISFVWKIHNRHNGYIELSNFKRLVL